MHFGGDKIFVMIHVKWIVSRRVPQELSHRIKLAIKGERAHVFKIGFECTMLHFYCNYANISIYVLLFSFWRNTTPYIYFVFVHEHIQILKTILVSLPNAHVTPLQTYPIIDPRL